MAGRGTVGAGFSLFVYHRRGRGVTGQINF